VVVAEEVQDPVRQVAVQLRRERASGGARRAGGGVDRHHHVAEERAARRGREREHVGGVILVPPRAVEPADGGVAHHQDRQLGVAPPERGEEAAGALAQPPRRGRAAGVLAAGVDRHGRRRSAFDTSCSVPSAGSGAAGAAPSAS
jgi:hypothetical protein